MRAVTLALTLTLLAPLARAAPPRLKPELAGLAFLVGDWAGGRGRLSKTGGSWAAASHIVPAANGAVLLRQDETHLFTAAGEPAGSFSKIMMIYPEAGTLHAEYADGTHVIHFASATITPGKSVSFLSETHPDAASFRLTYVLTAPDTLAVAFAIAPSGTQTYHPIAIGTLKKSN